VSGGGPRGGDGDACVAACERWRRRRRPVQARERVLGAGVPASRRSPLSPAPNPATWLMGLVDLATGITDPASSTAEDVPRRRLPMDGLNGSVMGSAGFCFFIFLFN